MQGKTLSPILTAKGVRLAVAVARFNERVTKALLEGALEAYARLGGEPREVLVAWVPGSFELPLVAKRLASRPDVDAVVALGAVIRGETPHFEYVAAQAASGLMQAMLQTEKPIVFGVLTTNSLEEALERSGGKAGNKGAEAVLTALEVVKLLEAIGRS
uniref:6,7-dimethyl-8-ribityllumazine synthase n=1 Tax=Thermus islandicus TaxID=540988 RepID=A0A7C2G4S5_9DEIN